MHSAIISRDNPPEANASGQTAKGPFTDGNEIVHLIIPIPFRKDGKMKKTLFPDPSNDAISLQGDQRHKNYEAA